MTPEMITAWASGLIALAALFVAVWQGYLSRQHNRLSLRPHLTFLHKLSDDNPRFFLELQNNGVGPAEIKDFRIYLDNKHDDHFEAPSWLTHLDSIGLKGKACGASYDPGEFLAAGKSLQILRYESRDDSTSTIQIRKALQRLRIEVTYRSVYGDEHEAIFTMDVSIFDCFDTEEE